MAHGPLYDLKTEAELMELLESFASDAELMEAIRKMGITAELTELLEPFANDAELMELIKKMGITVEQTVSPVAPKHNIPPKWYGAQFHASDYRLIVDWLNEIGAVDCKISQFNNIVSGAMFFVLAAVLGGRADIAMAMGPDEELATPFMEPVTLAVCESCAVDKDFPVAALGLEFESV